MRAEHSTSCAKSLLRVRDARWPRRGHRWSSAGADPSGRFMLVGEAPGADEDREGRPFVGQAGRELDAAIGATGAADEPVYITNTVKCRPPGNRPPTPGEVEACRPFLDLELLVVRPDVVVALGVSSMNRLVDAELERIADHDGEPRRVDGTWRLATYPPVAAVPEHQSGSSRTPDRDPRACTRPPRD